MPSEADALADLISDAGARAAYFSEPKHAGDVIWTAFGTPNPIDFAFLETSTDWKFADQFEGFVPRYSDLSNPSGSGLGLAVAAQLLIDSNVANRLARYYFGDTKDPSERSAVLKFLKWFAAAPNLNINPAHNIVERIARSTNLAESKRYAKRVLVSTMAIETMDREHFLKTDDIRIAPEGRSHLRNTFGSDDLESIAEIQLSNPYPTTGEIVHENYLLLLKTALIDAKVRERNLVEKIESFADFVETRFGIVAPFELGAALLQFTKATTKFLTLIRDATFERNVDRIQRAAWDSLYMRAPQAMLAASNPSMVNLCFPMTCDKEAAMVMAASKFRAMVVRANGFPLPLWSIDYPAVLGRWRHREDIEPAIRIVHGLLDNRTPVKAPKTDFASLTEELHRELRDYLG